MDKCFCHLNGLAVKDALARKELEELKPKVNAMYEKPGKILFKSETGIPGGYVWSHGLFCGDIDKYRLVLVDGILCSVEKGVFIVHDTDTDIQGEIIGYRISGYYSSGIGTNVVDSDLRGAARTEITISLIIEDHDGEFHIISNESHVATCTYEDWPEEIFRQEIFEIIGLV